MLNASRSTAVTASPSVCLWLKDGSPNTTLPALRDSVVCDTAIVGAGFTGLWTAYWLNRLQPERQIVIVEAEQPGFGASGRNGGWVIGHMEGLSSLLKGSSIEQRTEACHLLTGLVSGFADILTLEDLECDFQHGGGVLSACRFPSQEKAARKALQAFWDTGFSEADYHWLDAESAQERVHARHTLGAIATPHIGVLHPFKLVEQLTQLLLTRGVQCFANSRIIERTPDTLNSAEGSLRAGQVIWATEGYASGAAPTQHRLLPVQSGMIATAPLSESQWGQIGFEGRPAFCDFSHLSSYLQKTADNRLVVGARGSLQPCHQPAATLSPDAVDNRFRHTLLQDLFPQLGPVEITHAWGGSLGIPRHFHPFVQWDPDCQEGTAGGYLGEGVAASFLFGHTLAELLLGAESPRTRAPWVNWGAITASIPRWEPAPLPWLGFSALKMLVRSTERWQSRQR